MSGSAKRNEYLKHLPDMLSKEQVAEMKRNAVCALTGTADDVTLDHFIPLEWGHGGSYIGNVYFVARRLNASKSNMNPFQWINRAKLREPALLSRWETLIRRLAAENGLSTKEFRKFVRWCETHKRSLEQLSIDARPSLELWKEHRAMSPTPALACNDR